jgi:flagella basal body P-ring formation protein FlgA
MKIRKSFFFEKKKQKTFIRWSSGSGGATTPSRAAPGKVFWLFFSKKNVFLACLSCHPVHAATLRTQTSLTTPDVHLSDLFDDAGAPAARILGTAPSPGDQMVIEAAQLAAIARQFGLDWRPSTGAEHVVLDRPGRPLPRDDALAALRAALPRAGTPDDRDIDLQAFAPPIIPVGTAAQVDVEQIDLDPISGRFTAMLIITGERMTSIHSRVTGRAEAMIELPVANRRILTDEILSADDVRPTRVRASLVRVAVVQTPTDAIGMQARHALAPGLPIALSDLQRPAAVRKNATVLITLASPGMAVTAIGQALDSGPIGGQIRVLNPVSRAIIAADITGPDQVTVAVGARAPTNQVARR